MTTLKAFKYRIYPNKSQQVLLNKTFGCVRVVWNHNVEVFNKQDENLKQQESALTSTQLSQQFEWMKSARRKEAKLKAAWIYNTVVNQCKTFIQQITTQLIYTYDFIAIEDLNIAGMVKNRKLAKSISDASFSAFYVTLSYKAA